MNSIRIGLLAWVLASPGTMFGADLAALTEDCNGCHGPQGVSADSDIPSIAGQAAAYIASSLRSFQEWGRPCKKSEYRHGDTSRPATKMCNVAAGLTDGDIEALSKHYGEMKFVPAEQEFDAAKAAAGVQLHQIHCEACHEQGGTVAARGPVLAGQWVRYLKIAIPETLTGEHLVPPLMEKELADFSADEIDALMNYYASQQD